MHDARETLQQLWPKHAKGIGIEKPSMPLLSQLVAAWSDPQRHYHSLRHLQECLQMLERWGKHAAARHEIGIALWFHDAVYDPQRDDNEDKSARWAAKALKEIGVADDKVRRIGKLIRATRHLAPTAKARAVRVDGLDLTLDIDLAILGSDRARFEEYERQVRLEYAHVPDEAFARGRADFIEALLGANPLYRTEIARTELETSAREPVALVAHLAPRLICDNGFWPVPCQNVAMQAITGRPTQPDLFDFDEPVQETAPQRRDVLVGTCSWSDPSLIQSKRFYPRGFSSSEKRLAYYASQFPIVEVNSSFFAMPQASKSALWAERTPADFVFNMKAFRLLTGHQTPPQSLPRDIAAALPPLAGRRKNYYYADVPDEIREELWHRFIEAIAPLKQAGKFRAAHFQFAPWVTNSPEWRAHVELCVERMAGHLLAVEFRNRTWFAEDRAASTLAWERELGVAHVIVDEPQGVGNYAQGVWEVTHPALAVVRLHGRNADTWATKGLAASSERFNYEYSDDEIAELAVSIVRLIGRAFEIVVLVNVNFEDQGVQAARRLEREVHRLREQGVL